MKINSVCAISAAVILIFSSCFTNKSRVNKSGMKFNPGHYVAVGPLTDLGEIGHLDEPAVRGVNKRYHWRALEPEKDVYDFSSIETDLAFLEGRGKQLVVFLMDKSFYGKGAMPRYLSAYEVISDGGGYSPVRWHPVVVERFLALGKALGGRFDSHPNFEGAAVQESALDMSENDYGKFGYTADGYRDALIAILTGLRNALPGSHVFWYQNFMPGDDGRRLRRVADAIEDGGVFMGGPDILPYNRNISRTSYPMYEEYRHRLTLFCSAQGDSYKHHKNDLRVDRQEPVHEEGYLTMEEIFLFARDSLHVRYLFWDYEYEIAEPGQRTFDDAVEIIRKYPAFNDSMGPLGDAGNRAKRH